MTKITFELFKDLVTAGCSVAVELEGFFGDELSLWIEVDGANLIREAEQFRSKGFPVTWEFLFDPKTKIIRASSSC